MANELTTPTLISDPALEMIMRDVMDSLCEFSLESGMLPRDCGFEIIEIYPAAHEKPGQRRRHTAADQEDSEIIEFPDLRRAAG